MFIRGAFKSVFYVYIFFSKTQISSYFIVAGGSVGAGVADAGTFRK